MEEMPQSDQGQEREHSNTATLPTVPLESSCSLITLPAEMLLLVVSYLPCARDRLALRCACRNLHALLSYPALWKRVVWPSYVRKDGLSLNTVLMISRPTLEYLQLTGPVPFSKFIPNMCRCLCLNKLELSGTSLSSAQLQTLLCSLSKLTFLSLDSDLLTVGPLLAHCGSLQWLMVSSSTEADTADRMCTFLQMWAKSGYTPLIVDVIFHVDSIFIYALSCGFPAMQTFLLHTSANLPLPSSKAMVRCYRRRKGPFGLTIQTPCAFSIRGPNPSDNVPVMYFAEEIANQGIYTADVFDTGMQDAASQTVGFVSTQPVVLPPVTVAPFTDAILASLSSLELSFKDAPRARSLQSIAAHCCNLCELNMEGYCPTDIMDGLSAIAEKCTKLRGLNLGMIPSSCFSSSVVLWEIISQMKSLTFCTIESCMFVPPYADGGQGSGTPKHGTQQRKSHCPSLDAEASQRMTEHLQLLFHLRALEVTACDMSHSDQDAVPSQCSSSMVSLPFTLLPMVANLSGLHYLRVKFPPLGAGRIVGLKEVLQNCRLRSLHIHSPTQLSIPDDPALYSSLSELYLACGNTSLTDSHVEALVAGGGLTRVYLLIHSMTPTGVFSLLQRSPQLQACHINLMTPVHRNYGRFKRDISRIVNTLYCPLFDFHFESNLSRSGTIPSHMDLTETNLGHLWLTRRPPR